MRAFHTVMTIACLLGALVLHPPHCPARVVLLGRHAHTPTALFDVIMHKQNFLTHNHSFLLLATGKDSSSKKEILKNRFRSGPPKDNVPKEHQPLPPRKRKDPPRGQQVHPTHSKVQILSLSEEEAAVMITETSHASVPAEDSEPAATQDTHNVMMVENDDTTDTTPMVHSELHTDDTDDAMEMEWMHNADAFTKALQERAQDTLMRGIENLQVSPVETPSPRDNLIPLPTGAQTSPAAEEAAAHGLHIDSPAAKDSLKDTDNTTLTGEGNSTRSESATGHTDTANSGTTTPSGHPESPTSKPLAPDGTPDDSSSFSSLSSGSAAVSGSCMLSPSSDSAMLMSHSFLSLS